MVQGGIIPTAHALADATTDPVLKALILERPHLAMIILAHPQDHLLITDGGVQVQWGTAGQRGSISIARSVADRYAGQSPTPLRARP